MKKLFNSYKKKIEKVTEDGEIRSLMIGISQDCSAYKLDWDEFMDLRKMLIKRGKEVGNKWIENC